MSQVGGASHVASPDGSVVEGLKGTMASASTSVWEKDAPTAVALMPDNSVSPSYASGGF